jgi:hypothetical protein
MSLQLANQADGPTKPPPKSGGFFVRLRGLQEKFEKKYGRCII